MVHDREVLVAAESSATSGGSQVTDAIAGFAGPSAFPQSAAAQSQTGAPKSSSARASGARSRPAGCSSPRLPESRSPRWGRIPRLVRSVPAPFGEIGVRQDVFRVRGTGFAAAASYGRDGSVLGAAVLRGSGSRSGGTGGFPSGCTPAGPASPGRSASQGERWSAPGGSGSRRARPRHGSPGVCPSDQSRAGFWRCTSRTARWYTGCDPWWTTDE